MTSMELAQACNKRTRPNSSKFHISQLKKKKGGGGALVTKISVHVKLGAKHKTTGVPQVDHPCPTKVDCFERSSTSKRATGNQDWFAFSFC